MLFFFQCSTVVEGAEDLISFTDLLDLVLFQNGSAKSPRQALLFSLKDDVGSLSDILKVLKVRDT